MSWLLSIWLPWEIPKTPFNASSAKEEPVNV
jgi:hypothetical protein